MSTWVVIMTRDNYCYSLQVDAETRDLAIEEFESVYEEKPDEVWGPFKACSAQSTPWLVGLNKYR